MFEIKTDNINIKEGKNIVDSLNSIETVFKTQFRYLT
jgi:hypothetical protein